MKSPGRDEIGLERNPCGRERIAVAVETVGGHRQVERPRDRGDLLLRAEQVLGRSPRAAAIVRVDEGQRERVARSSRHHDGDAGGDECAWEGVVAVLAQHDHAVDVALKHVSLDLLLRTHALREQEDELQVRVRDRFCDPLNDRRVERVGERPLLGLAGDESDRVGTPPREAARGRVRHVSELCDGAFDRRPGGGAHAGRAVQHAGHGRRGDARERRDLFERRACAVGPDCHRRLSIASREYGDGTRDSAFHSGADALPRRPAMLRLRAGR